MSTFSNPLTEYSPQMEASEFSSEMQFEQDAGKVFSESEELELASRFLEVTNEQEFEYFLGDLIERAGISLGKFVDLPLGQSVASVLKMAARKVLPAAASSYGNDLAGSLGAKLGTGLAAIAGNTLGLELEG
ncbi:hypothetical protein [Tunturiibacter gelidiferens]|uniref:hypothetical protein n=1 Tax=Tunturiibacter gelidiferens TaxID=3069689 RepID=UPI003D9B8B87